MIPPREGDRRLSPSSKIGRIRWALLLRLAVHERENTLPTSSTFLYYELEQLGVRDYGLLPGDVTKEKRAVKAGNKGTRGPRQEVIDALKDLRDFELVPWDAIYDLKRKYTSWQMATTVAEYVADAAKYASIDRWDGQPAPLLLCESEAAAFALTRTANTHWVSEGSPLTEEDPGIDELVITPSKLTALVKISREMAADSVNPGAAAIVGQGVVTQIQRQLDTAYFGSNAENPNQPKGLVDLVGYQNVYIDGEFENLDWAIEAETLLNQVGATATAFVASASTVSILARLKEFQPTLDVISNETLLQADPTQRTKYTVNGTPLFWVLDGVIPDGLIWALCADGPNPKAFVVQRQDVELITSPGRISVTTAWHCERCCGTDSRGHTRRRWS